MTTKGVTRDIVISLISLYNVQREAIVYDTSDFTSYALQSGLKDTFLRGYASRVYDAYLKYLATGNKIDIDYMCRVNDERLRHIKTAETLPCHKILHSIKTYRELEIYVDKLKVEKEYNCFVNTKEDYFLHINNHLCIYKNSMYLPEYIVLDYTEKSKDIWVPNTKFDEDENSFTIMVGYLMKKFKDLNLK